MATPPPADDTVRPRRAKKVVEEWDATVLETHEVFWRDLQPWLLERGYQLRPRFRPGWVASWEKGKHPWDYEDGVNTSRGQVIDATRTTDGEMVYLKRVRRNVHPHEVEVTELFSSEPLKSHQRNHCVPVFEVLSVPNDDNLAILVLPLLREFDSPQFQTVGEGVEFFRQVFEGLQFMHQNHVAHRDCMGLNIMMDARPTYPKMYHPEISTRSRDWKSKAKHYTRTSRPVKYYLIDFGLSRQYAADDTAPLELPIMGGDKSVPEFRVTRSVPCNPFPTDIYYLGNMIREDFIQKFRGFEFMLPLVNDMVQDDPTKRPTIDEVVNRFQQIYRSLSWWSLRSRPVPGDEISRGRLFRRTRHFFRTTVYILTLRSALPRPPRVPLHTFEF